MTALDVYHYLTEELLKMTAPAAPVTLTPATPAKPAAPAVAEPAGAARFTAASYPNPPIKTAASAPAAPKTPAFIAALKDDPEAAMTALEARLTELENVVHQVVGQNNPHHGAVTSWLKKMGAKVTAAVKKL